ncbi:MAG TPA: GNAT family N-acetyltransferase [Pyrinomonadaceae bacterium]|jgi:ribosomal protein S18 acetylase RimI-like enzyme
MELTVRKFEPKDAADGARLVKSFAGKTVSAEYLQRFLSNPANYLIVAEAGNELAGFLLGYRLERLKEESFKFFIYEIDVVENFRRRGVGTALIEYAKNIVSRENMINAFVFTNYSNAGAVEFYKSTGAEIENGDDLMFVYAERIRDL